MAQAGVVAAFDVDMSAHVRAYQHKRDMVEERLGSITEVVHPGGAFYAFVRAVPPHATATELVERAVERNVLVIPGSVFSRRDTHFRLSYATGDETLKRGLEILADLITTAP